MTTKSVDAVVALVVVVVVGSHSVTLRCALPVCASGKVKIIELYLA